MEKITVTSVTIKKQGERGGIPWTIREITSDDGRKFDSFDEFKEGETAEVTITPNSNPSYNANIKRVKESKGKFPAKDWGTQKKIVALESSVELEKMRPTESLEQMFSRADKILEWLNK